MLPRRAYWLAGTQAWGIALACALLSDMASDVVLFVAEAPIGSKFKAIPASKTRTQLGQSFQAVVFDAHLGFDVNAFGLVVGTLRAGGVLLLLAPPLAEWRQTPDRYRERFIPYLLTEQASKKRFVERFGRLVLASTDWRVLGKDSHPKTSFGGMGAKDSHSNSSLRERGAKGVVLTLEQERALQGLEAASGLTLLLGARGRGKSTLLGVYAAEASLHQSIIVTAPQFRSVELLLRLAQDSPSQNTVRFFAPDELLRLRPDADMLMVDEAAALPLPMLLQMVECYPQAILATSTEGYEGSGQGFALKFRAALQAMGRSWQVLQLREPLRWGYGDWLEAFCAEVLLLRSGAALTPIPLLKDEGLEKFCAQQKTQYRSISQDELLGDEALLRQVFGLLLLAHYQTRPSDLLQLLDAPNVSVHVLEHGKEVLAVALLSSEGGLDAELTLAIQHGKRRPQGHLLAQTLTYHAQLAGAAGLTCERVMRIAVVPTWQGRGLGTTLLQALIEYARALGRDYIGVSYAATPDVIRFWQRTGFVLARQGFKPDRASGSVSLVQVLGLSSRGEAFFRQSINPIFAK